MQNYLVQHCVVACCSVFANIIVEFSRFSKMDFKKIFKYFANFSKIMTYFLCNFLLIYSEVTIHDDGGSDVALGKGLKILCRSVIREEGNLKNAVNRVS